MVYFKNKIKYISYLSFSEIFEKCIIILLLTVCE